MDLFRRWAAGSSSAQGPTDRGTYELVGQPVIGSSRRIVASDALKDTVPESEDFDGNAVGNAVGDGPTKEELRTLRKVADRLPWAAFLVAIVELCERFTYYGISGPFQNYISNSYHDPSGLPGAIGLDQKGATALTNFFQFWCYVTPILGAVIADSFLGKYRTIYYFSIIYAAGVLILFLTSLPIAIENGYALGGLVVAMIVIGLGTGGIKSNVSPMIAEQCITTQQFVRTTSRGERVIVDPALTIQRIYMVFYMCINIGSLSSILTTNMELHIGFWSAYLLCFFTFLAGFATLIMGKEKYIMHPPEGSVIPRALRVCWIGLKNRSLNAAKDQYLRTTPGSQVSTPWDDVFVEEVRRALSACKVFLFFPVYWLVQGQMVNNLVSQAGQMQLHGIPNDVMSNIDPLTIIIFIPLCDRFLYPALRKAGIAFKPITRMFAGFVFAAAAMAYAAFVQRAIYNAGPCYTAPLACDAGKLPGGRYLPNEVHVAAQVPAFLFIGLSEIFAAVTGLEYAFTQAPASMKSFIMSMFLLTTAIGALMGGIISPLAVDPTLLWMYIGLVVVALVGGVFFWRTFKHLNDFEDL
ncbi:MFS peptide transporter Ptr2 like protein [Zymoseptoria brevis]|uniref:MFS peptide transporter Ptr2 like protein n=1 Tax=Zymoseptoria brevis TaxID=1047168 RepID=A0A0F4GS05_9PEZI|nr:MFS peptide transporter Ptr2 like protein [Zymoseptoria brevis]